MKKTLYILTENIFVNRENEKKSQQRDTSNGGGGAVVFFFYNTKRSPVAQSPVAQSPGRPVAILNLN